LKALILILFLYSCSTVQRPGDTVIVAPAPVDPIVVAPIEPPSATPALGQKIKIWATMYYAKEVQARSSGVPLRNMSDQVIGPFLSSSDWCNGAIEGTVVVGGETYNYAGVKSPVQASCSHKPSERVRWKKSPFKYGIGNRNNPLIPFVTIACDQGTVGGSKKWLNGSYMKFGQKIFIPNAKGAALPDGSKHDGIFICGDTGGAITGNHIDVFIGVVSGGLQGALRVNPFNFIESSASKTFDAYLVD
jgi:hypothetical protein